MPPQTEGMPRSRRHHMDVHGRPAAGRYIETPTAGTNLAMAGGGDDIASSARLRRASSQ
jgi:hypothetical protein